MRTKFNWGLLSTARINRAVIPGLKESPLTELAAVASRSKEAAVRYAAEWDIPKAYGSYEALLADPDIHAVYIPLPNHLHAEWTIRACEAGKHVLCEKPLALNVDEVDAIAAAAQRNNVSVMEAFMYRFHPQTEYVQELVASGALGEVRAMSGTFSFMLTRPNDIRLLPEAGGGSLWDVGCYPVSYAQMLAGSPAQEVFGFQQSGPSGVDLLFTGELRFAGGRLAQISSAFSLPFFTGFEIRGSEATALIRHPYKSFPNSEVIVLRDDAEERKVFPAFDIYRGEIENLTAAALYGTPPRLSLQESRGHIAALTALYESAQTGKAVRLQPLARAGSS